jgi:NhaP-type Na+/H+ and K+/H+ antiporter
LSQDLSLLGDVILPAATPLFAITAFYDATIAEDKQRDITLEELMVQKLKGVFIIGDRVQYQNITLSVAEIINDKITKVGLWLPEKNV